MSIPTVSHVDVSLGNMYVLFPVGWLEPVAMTYPKEVAQGNRKTDGESRAAQVVTAAFVSGGKDAEYQLQGQEELYSHSLACCRVVVELGGRKRGLSGGKQVTLPVPLA